MTLEEAIKTLDEVIPHPSNKMVDYTHLPIAIAWQTIKERTADVVPRSDVEEILKFKDMAYAELKSQYLEAKQEVAREIFAEIEAETELYDRYEPIVSLIDFLAELKKKYIGE